MLKKMKTRTKKRKEKPKVENPKFLNVNININVVHIHSNLKPIRRKKRKQATKSNLPLLQNLNLQNQLNNLQQIQQQQRLEKIPSFGGARVNPSRIRSESPTIFYNQYDTPIPPRLPIKEEFSTPFQRTPPRQLPTGIGNGNISGSSSRRVMTRSTRTPQHMRDFEYDINRRR